MLLLSKHEPRSTATLGREATQHSTPRRNKNPITRPKEKLSCILQANSTNQEKNTHTDTQPRKDFRQQKTEPNHNKKRQQTNNQTKQSKNGIPETSTDKKSMHTNTLTPAKRDVQISKLELSSPPPPPPRNPTTPQAKEKTSEGKDTAKCKRWIRRETRRGFCSRTNDNKTNKGSVVLSAPGIELVMERRARQKISLSK
jgi:hypothetical protein